MTVHKYMNDDHSVDFLKKKYNLVPNKKQADRKKKALKIFGALFAVTIICGLVSSYNLSQEYEEDVAEYESFSLFSSLRTLMGSDDKELTGEQDDRINVLLLGIGGYGHDGPELTDTIIFSSYKPSTNEIGMMSIPRDLAVPIPGYGYQKINHINAYGEIENLGHGPEWSSDIIGDLLNQEIHYYVKVDFDGFVDLINSIGGIDVYVEQAFADYQYPTDDDLVQTITFERGWTEMDGETALQFARSRHGTNGEGSDFARAERQQKILLAVKDQILSASTFLNPSKLNNLIETFQDNVETNMSFWELMKMTRYIPDISADNIHTTVLEPGAAESPLYSATINSAYVLLPKRDDWSSVQSMAKNIFSDEISSSLAQKNTEIGSTTNIAKIEIQNGTKITGLAFQTSQMLSGTNFSIVNIGNADSDDYEKTIIYDLTGGKMTTELEILKDFLEADVAMSASGWIFSNTVVPIELTVETPESSEEDIDFLIIIGQNATNLVLQ